ncbi:serine/threonine protein kinase [Actinokineospora diospyrosa]|uniref:Protein kinase domain-containing protein n=1 Tax=Actinokineospora diospyrosa TaxID=103728 RepID=A0ABT1I7V1_9PSEU|nr:serine/threonine-protein kinase [Actinokineospora diospyrosa]MCP2268706.1 hypothetical protein [Actinokineospora diospyrosa]
MSTTVSPSSLGRLGPMIGKGGQAQVYLAPAVGFPDVPSVVYKKYRPGHSPPGGLDQLVARRLRLDPATRARLDSLTAWPLRVVADDAGVHGVLVRLIPDSFFQDRVLPGGDAVRSLRELQFLLIDPARASRLGMPAPTTAQRALVCRDFAAAVHLLHKLDIVIGDINPTNAVFRLDQRPTAMLVDCDAVRVRGSAAVVAQLDMPDWEAPERLPSQATDLYKLGLVVLRCLAPGAGGSVSRDLSRAADVLDREGRGLLAAALGRDAAARPSAQTWGRYFDRVLAGVSAPVPGSTTSAWRRGPGGTWIEVAR